MKTVRVWLTFNGEIYNFQQLRPDSSATRPPIYLKTDTEVLIHLYEERGLGIFG